MKSLRSILNIFLTFAVLYVAKEYFPEYVRITGTRELIVTVLLLTIADTTYSLGLTIFLIPFMMSCFKSNNAVGFLSFITIIITVILSAFIWTPVNLYLVSSLYKGFTIIGGFLTYLILSIILSMFSIKFENKKE